MEVKKTKPAVVQDFLKKLFASATTVSLGAGNFTFPPSKEFIQELTSNFTSANVSPFENGYSFSSYYVCYHVGMAKGEAIYKATSFSYPSFTMYDTEEEYRLSFSLND